MERPDRVLLGQIAGAHGIRGEVLVRTFTENPGDIASYGELTDSEGGRPLRLEARKLAPKGLVARVAGVSDRNGAEALKGAELWVARELLPPPEEGSFYYADLIGLEAVDTQGVTFGRVVRVANYGAGDLLEIELDKGEKSELVPFKAEYVPEVDIESGRVVIAWPLQFEIAQPDPQE